MTGLGDALVDVFLRGVALGRPRLRNVADWIADAARPPHGVRLVADDGSEYTGVVLVERNRPIVMLAVNVGHDTTGRYQAPQQRYAPPFRRDRGYHDEPNLSFEDEDWLRR